MISTLCYLTMVGLFGILLRWSASYFLHRASLLALRHTIASLEKNVQEAKDPAQLWQEKHLQASTALATALAYVQHLEKKVVEQGKSFEQVQAHGKIVGAVIAFKA